MAVQGGLLATIPGAKKAAIFLGSKLLAYTVLGLLLGGLGSALTLTAQMKGIFAFLAGAFMIGSALAVFDVHPIFRYFILQPPKFIYKFLRNISREQADNFFAPIILGAFTVLIPCGTTQAMEVLAVSSGNAMSGALTLFAFVLGTIPTFYILSLGVAKLNLAKVTAVIVLILGLISINSSLNLFGVNPLEDIFLVKQSVSNAVAATDVTINVLNNGYSPSTVNVKKGENIKLNLVTSNLRGCNSTFELPMFNIEKYLPATGNTVVEFKAPDSPTTISFTCGMGMYRGTIKVI